MTSDMPSLFHRLRFTPLTDLMRGRVSSRLDWGGAIERCDLPDPLRDRVTLVVRRTRLWRSERVEVAQELIAHFHDGLAAGRTPDELIRAFGDPLAAAKLVRRAKILNRSFLWHVARRVRMALFVFVALYALAIGVLLLRKPVISVDYYAKINASIDKTPVEDHAWPIYRQAWIEHDIWHSKLYEAVVVDIRLDERRYVRGGRLARPGDPSWPRAVAGVERRASLIEAARRGSVKPILGLRAGGEYSDDNWVAWNGPDKPKPVTASSGSDRPPYLFSVHLPPMGHFLTMTRLVAIDLRLAGEQGDRQRAIADYRAMLGIARQVRGLGTMMEQMHSSMIVHSACEGLADVLAHHAAIFHDDDLVALAHLAAEAARTCSNLDTTVEEWSHLDAIQQAYSDDGRGNGRITAEGIRWYAGFGHERNAHAWLSLMASADATPPVRVLALPTFAATLVTRREAEEATRRHFALCRELGQRPLWEQIRKPNAADEAANQLMQNARSSVIAVSLPKLDSPNRQAGKLRALGEALAAALAVEKFRRDQGRLPTALAELVPQYLPATPIDHSTGQPLLITERDGRAVVYGRGLDGVDDHGAPPPPNASGVAGLPTKGDWVLFPPTFLPEATPIEPPATRPITNHS